MKKAKLLFAVIFLATCTSCVTTLFTHKQVMDNAVIGKTKDEIIKTFGLPSQKQTEGNYEQWIYDLGEKTTTLSRPSMSNTNVNINPTSNTANVRTTEFGGRSESETYKKYVKVVLQDDLGIKWDSVDVDYSVTEQNNVGTVFYVLGVVGGGILLGVLLALI